MNVMIIGLICAVAVIILLMGVLSIWRKVPQDKALVVTGLKKRVISGGGGIVIPFLERCDEISLENMSIPVSVTNSLSYNGVPLNVTGTVIVKIGATDNDILAAMMQFNTGNSNGTITNIKDTVKEVLEGKLREIVSTLKVEELYQNREQFSSNVNAVSTQELRSMGLEIKTFTIRELSDDNGYLKSLGVRQTEEVKRQAAIAKAEAERDTAIKVAEAERDTSIQIAESERLSKEKKLEAATLIAKAEKDNNLKVAAYRQEQETAKATADSAYEIEKNLRQKEITDAKMQVEIKERQMQTELATQETLRKQEELNAQVQKTAEAEKFKAIQEVEAEKARKMAEADAEAHAIKVKAIAEAEAVKLKGEADANAIRLRGEAEADSMKKQADAYKEYGEAAILQLMVEKLPEIASAISAPLSQTEKIVIMDNGGENGGAGKIAGYVNNIAGMVPEIMQTLTGKNIMDIMEKALTKTNSVNNYLSVDSTEENESSTHEECYSIVESD